MSRLRSFVLHDQHTVGHLVLLRHWLVYVTAGSRPEGSNPSQIRAINLTTGRTIVVARTRYRHGIMDWADGTGNTIVYTDQSREQTDDSFRTKWTLTARNLVTGSSALLDSSHGRAADTLPAPYAGDDQAVWLVDGPTRGRDRIRVASLSAFTVHTLPTPRRAAEAGITAGHVVWVDATTGQILSEDFHTHRTVQLSRGSKAGQVRATDGYAVWPTPRINDPTRIWVAPVGRASSGRVLLNGYNEQPVAGSTFVVYFADYGAALDVISLHGGQPVAIAHSPYVPSRYATYQDRVVFAITRHEDKPSQTTTLVMDVVHAGNARS